ncbi:MAG: pilus assembly PilX N-terminal domain-containing protein [Terriglobia bacterium]
MKNHAAQDSGTALIVAMLLMLVLSIMLIGFYFLTTGEQKVSASNRDNEVTYYAAVAGLEQMSNLIADYFSHTAAPTPAEIISYTTTPSNFQTLPGITSSYTLYCTAPGTTAMVACSSVGSVLGSSNGSIGGNGPLAGLEGVITPFQLTVTADGPNNTEVKLNRTVQEVAVPIFEFGIFSDSDLSFFAGDNFNFGGRVHTNGNLFLAEDGGSTLNLNDHVTAAKGIIRDQLSNGYVMATYPSGTCTSTNYCSTVNVLTTSGGCPSTLTGTQSGNCLTLGLNQGSLEGGAGSTENPNWKTLSLTTYNGFIQDGTTGAKVLNLAIALPGINSQPIAMLQRPPVGELTTGPLGMARFYNQASLRILLSDTQADIMNLPGIDTTEYPYPLAEYGSTAPTNMPYTIQRTTSIPSTYCPQNSNCYLPPADACHPPLAESVGSSDTDYMLAQSTTLLGGYIKIEMQLESSPGTWKDVTEEILAQGISRDEASGTAMPAATLAKDSGGALSAKTTYYYEVTAVNAWGQSSGTVAQETTGSSRLMITVSWPAVTGATGYNVYRTTTPGTYTGTGNGVINLVVGTPQGTSWMSPYSPTATFTDSGAITPTSSASGPPSSSCTNTAIIHLEEAAPGVSLTGNPINVLTPSNFVPINMYDAREGEVRDTTCTNGCASPQTNPTLNGIMNLVEIDVGNLQQWYAGNIATSGKYAFNGPDALDNSGYILYVSDRRMNCNDGQYDLEGNCASGFGETGEFGNEDLINPSVQSGAPNGVLDAPEDVDGTGVLYTYGAYAHPIATPQSVSPSGVTVGGATTTGKWPAIISSLANSSTENPVEVRITGTQAQKNSVVVFRRALRLVNGTLGNLPPLAAAQAATCSGGTAGGFTVTSENPVYIQGDYNASVANAFNDAAPLCHVPASVMADTVTLLSNNWWLGAQPDPSSPYSGDANSFANPTTPNCPNQRCATTTYYRTAIMAGKNNSFPFYANGTTPTFAGLHQDFGTDGGTHNFLRYNEDWGNATLNYLGSMASFYISRQGTGIYKCCNTVYNPPTRNYTFDTDFQNISELPPGTPRFTDVNALSYFQSVLPNQ